MPLLITLQIFFIKHELQKSQDRKSNWTCLGDCLKEARHLELQSHGSYRDTWRTVSSKEIGTFIREVKIEAKWPKDKEYPLQTLRILCDLF